MPLVTSRQMLLGAQRGGYAIAACNVENMEMAQAVILAAEAEKAPVIVQTTGSTLRYASPFVFAGMVAALAREVSVPIALHLDHGVSFELAETAVKAGYTSIMIDGSRLPFEENLTLAKRVVSMASSLVPVEAELGLVGGIEDELESEENAGTDPKEAAEFVARTGIFSLAVAIGTAHGVYLGAPKLDFKRLAAIRERTDAPLVLHGASGVPDADVQACIRLGVCKVNIATELRIAYTAGVRSFLENNPDAYDPKQPGKAGMEAVIALAREKIRLVRSSGKAV